MVIDVVQNADEHPWFFIREDGGEGADSVSSSSGNDTEERDLERRRSLSSSCIAETIDAVRSEPCTEIEDVPIDDACGEVADEALAASSEEQEETRRGVFESEGRVAEPRRVRISTRACLLVITVLMLVTTRCVHLGYAEVVPKESYESPPPVPQHEVSTLTKGGVVVVNAVLGFCVGVPGVPGLWDNLFMGVASGALSTRQVTSRFESFLKTAFATKQGNEVDMKSNSA